MNKVLHVLEYSKGGVATVVNMYLNDEDINKDFSQYVLLNKVNEGEINSDKRIYYSSKRGVWGCLVLGVILMLTCHRLRPSIVHLHSSFPGVVGRLLLAFYNVKVVYQPHGVSFDRNRVSGIKFYIFKYLEKLLSKFSKNIISVSMYEKKEIKECIGVDSALIRNGVNDIFYEPVKRNGRILFVGRLDEQKGLDTVLDLFKKEKIKNYLDVIGESVLHSYDNHELDKVNFLGWCDKKTLEKKFGEYSVVVMPSRWEAFGLVAIEAMRSGTPVVCSNVGALPSIIEDGLTGYIFEKDSIDKIPDLLEKAVKLIDNSKCRNKYLQEYTADEMCRKLKKYYKGLLCE